ncbi:hypothetical protein [Kitasatospora paranensis]|uniref:Uncharacterized protein n=1 Tax=Kitasatospora paranensis TaxID=258053 RepID=A0ABW2G1M6_9ACTN
MTAARRTVALLKGAPVPEPAPDLVQGLAEAMAEADAVGWHWEQLPETGRTEVANQGEDLLLLMLEPLGEDYWLRPGEVVQVVSRGPVQSGPVFAVRHGGDSVEVCCNSFFGTVEDEHGSPLDCGHQRPPGAFRTAADDAAGDD